MTRVFIVYAHMSAASFNRALLDCALGQFERDGHEVRVSDLYAMGFHPVVGPADFAFEAPGDCDYYALQKRAGPDLAFCPQIRAELDKLDWCDLLVLQFPLYWFSVPAILKGWIDRVFVPGIAYGGGRWYDRGGYAGKRALVSTTMAAYDTMMSPQGINGLLAVNVWPLLSGTLAFCGFDVLAPAIFNAAPYASHEARRQMLDRFAACLQCIDGERPLSFHRRSDFGPDFQLTVPPRTVGHHFANLDPAALAPLRWTAGTPE